MYVFVYAYLLLCCFNGILSQDQPEIDTPHGTIVGSYGKSFSGRKYAIFEGVPYAKPPVDERRFKPPEEITTWRDTIYATTRANVCIQFKFGSVKGVEDCLYLNIYVPILVRHQPLPVVFAIHGGAFLTGTAYSNVTFLMDKNIIFVSTNYRLGVLGFLSTEDEHISGNMGLKDQSMALRWVSKYIHLFGGDPKKITLLGQSAGAACVHYHYLSPLSKGLFQNGISLSGTAFAAGKLHKYSLEMFKKLAAATNCLARNIPESVECLRRKPVKDIVDATKHFYTWAYLPVNPFGPVVEKGSQKPFIDRLPIEIIRSGDAADVLWINSIVSDEGLVPGAPYMNRDSHLEYFDKNWNSIAPHLFMYNYTLPREYHDYYSKMIRKHYFGDEKITKINQKALIRSITDRLYCFSALQAAKIQAESNESPVLFLYYQYRALTSFSDVFMKDPEDFGVCHSDDIKMIMGNPIIDPMRRPEDRAVQLKLLDMLVSVASEGYPNIGQRFMWESVNRNFGTVDMLFFTNSTNIKMESPTNFCEYQFWKSLNAHEN